MTFASVMSTVTTIMAITHVKGLEYRSLVNFVIKISDKASRRLESRVLFTFLWH